MQSIRRTFAGWNVRTVTDEAVKTLEKSDKKSLSSSEGGQEY